MACGCGGGNNTTVSSVEQVQATLGEGTFKSVSADAPNPPDVNGFTSVDASLPDEEVLVDA